MQCLSVGPRCGNIAGAGGASRVLSPRGGDCGKILMPPTTPPPPPTTTMTMVLNRRRPAREQVRATSCFHAPEELAEDRAKNVSLGYCEKIFQEQSTKRRSP